MKIIVIGASGTIGKAVVAELSPRHEIIKVGKSSGDFQCDITDESQIRALFQKTGPFDAVVSATGSVHFESIEKMTPKLFDILPFLKEGDSYCI